MELIHRQYLKKKQICKERLLYLYLFQTLIYGTYYAFCIYLCIICELIIISHPKCEGFLYLNYVSTFLKGMLLTDLEYRAHSALSHGRGMQNTYRRLWLRLKL